MCLVRRQLTHKDFLLTSLKALAKGFDFECFTSPNGVWSLVGGTCRRILCRGEYVVRVDVGWIDLMSLLVV